MTSPTALLTAEEYCRLPDNGQPTELVSGKIVTLSIPFPRNGQICSRVNRVVGNFVDGHCLGHLVSNRSAVITEHDPDTVRGADIAFYSYAKVPKVPIPRGYLSVPPDVVFEVRSDDDRCKKILAKVAEYLNAGVTVVCVLDEPPPTIYVHTADQPVRILSADQELFLPDVLPGLSVPVRGFFE